MAFSTALPKHLVNLVELGQAPTVLGRNSFLFHKDDRGAVDNAVFYSFIESCMAVHLNLLDWLTDVLGKLRGGIEEEQIVRLFITLQKILGITSVFIVLRTT